MTEHATLLFVDDEPLAAEEICEFLSEEGFNTIQAYDGLEALVKIKAHYPDLVLLDIKMPKLNGLEIMKIIKTKFHHSGVIILTAVDDEQTFDDLRQAGALNVLTKPINLNALLTTIHSALKLR